MPPLTSFVAGAGLLLSAAALASEPAPAPKLVFENPTRHFGLLSFTDSVEHAFRFRNEGDAPLVVRHVEVSCGCSLAGKPEGSIPPGGEGEIRLAIRGAESFYDTKAFVETNEPPDRNRHTLFMSVHFLGAVEIDPPSFAVHFDGEEAPAWRTVHIRNFDAEALLLMRLETTQDIRRFVDISSVTVETGREYAVVFHLKETPRSGLAVGDATLTLRRGHDGVAYSFHVQVSPPPGGAAAPPPVPPSRRGTPSGAP